jgi:hypothetical protein
MAYISKRNRRREKERKTAAKNRREIIAAGLSRREMMKLGLLTSAGMLVPIKGLSARARNSAGMFDDIPCESPPTKPFVEPLPTHTNGGMVLAQDVPAFSNVAECPPQPNPCPTPREGRTRPHQGFARFPPERFIEVHQRRTELIMHPQLPPQPVWGFARLMDPPNVAWSPGPTYVAHYDQPILVRNFNDLPKNNEGFGRNQVSTHVHNGHTPSESDGFPCDWYDSGKFYDQHYPNALAGFDSTHPPKGDINESLSTLWYHDHRVDFTAQNVYKGLAGFYLLPY